MVDLEQAELSAEEVATARLVLVEESGGVLSSRYVGVSMREDVTDVHRMLGQSDHLSQHPTFLTHDTTDSARLHDDGCAAGFLLLQSSFLVMVSMVKLIPTRLSL